MWSSPRVEILTQKVRAAAQADPEWFQQHAATATPGEPIPYHPKLGLTRAEHQELLELSTTIEMRPADTVRIQIEPTGTGWRLGAGSDFPSLAGLEIDTIANVVRSTFGTLEQGEPILPSDGQQATGSWGGPRWSLEASDQSAMSSTVATVAIGRHLASNRTVLYLDLTTATNGQVTLRERRFLKFMP